MQHVILMVEGYVISDDKVPSDYVRIYDAAGSIYSAIRNEFVTDVRLLARELPDEPGGGSVVRNGTDIFWRDPGYDGESCWFVLSDQNRVHGVEWFQVCTYGDPEVIHETNEVWTYDTD